MSGSSAATTDSSACWRTQTPPSVSKRSVTKWPKPDQAHQSSLAAIRRAVGLTQVDLAERMGVKQSAISGLERRPDVLLSTLAGYLAAAGGTNIRVMVTLNGADIEYTIGVDALADQKV